jgi:hypothetical protein
MVDLYLIKPCGEEISLDLKKKKKVTMVMYNKFRYFGKGNENSNGPIISNRRSFP